MAYYDCKLEHELHRSSKSEIKTLFLELDGELYHLLDLGQSLIPSPMVDLVAFLNEPKTVASLTSLEYLLDGLGTHASRVG